MHLPPWGALAYHALTIVTVPYFHCGIRIWGSMGIVVVLLTPSDLLLSHSVCSSQSVTVIIFVSLIV